MADSLRLQPLFQEIRTSYFPSWDSENSWTIQHSDESRGYCDKPNKTIWVGPPTENYTMPVLIIHEIAHATTATTTDNHGEEWVSEMHRVSSEAAKHGGKQLAQDLQKHIAWVKSGYDVTDDIFYDEISQYVSDSPDSTFDSIMRHMAREYGQSVEILLEQFPQSRKYYQSAGGNDESTRPPTPLEE